MGVHSRQPSAEIATAVSAVFRTLSICAPLRSVKPLRSRARGADTQAVHGPLQRLLADMRSDKFSKPREHVQKNHAGKNQKPTGAPRRK